MSEPKRFDCYILGGNSIDEASTPDGEFVRYEDYARLKKELERHTKERSEDDIGTDLIPRRFVHWWMEEVARLKAEVERLQSIHSIDSIGIEHLKSEVERLTSDIQMEKENEDRLVREWQKANNEVYGLQTQVAALIDDQTRLKAEVERLTKAGDELVLQIEWRNVVIVDPSLSFFKVSPDCLCNCHNFDKVIEAWNAAKEGKQS